MTDHSSTKEKHSTHPKASEESSPKSGFSPILIALTVVVILAVGIMAVYWYTSPAPNPDTNGPIFPTFETNDLNVIVINEPQCPNCMRLDGLVDSLESNPSYQVAFREDLDSTSARAQSLIRDYNIQSLPTAIITGEVKNDLQTSWRNSGLATPDGNLANSIDNGSTLVLRAVKYPYYSIPKARVMGEVQIIVISDANCTRCRELFPDMNQDANGVVAFNQPLAISADATGNDQVVFVSTIQFLDKNSLDANKLITQYNLKRLPSILVSPSATDYKYIDRFSGELGFTTAKDGWLYNDKNPPFLVLESGNVRGIVNVIMISDENCITCFNPSVAFRQFFQTYDVVVGQTNYFGYDSNEGKDLIDQYNLRHLPALIANQEVLFYPKLSSEWQTEWGTIEGDGNFVFRAVPRMAALAIDGNMTYTTLDENGNIVG